MLPRIHTFSPAFVFCLIIAASAQILAQSSTKKTEPLAGRNIAYATATTSREQRAIKAFNAAKQSPLQLNAFLARMPKGADLHMHLSGAVYAETFIKDAAADLLCVNPTTLSFTKNTGTTRSLPPHPVCGEAHVPAAEAFKDQKLYDALVDAFSMRAFVPSSGVSGHDQFFATFDRFRSLNKSHTGEWLDEVATRAASQNEQYLEVMETPIFTDLSKIVSNIEWPTTPVDPAQNRTGDATGTRHGELSHLRATLLD